MGNQDNPAILVVGSMNMDLVLETERLPEPGESYFGDRYHYVLGGKGANQAVAAAKLGLDVVFVGRVGNDEHGNVVRENLRRQGIATDLIAVDPEQPTGLAVIILEPTGENRIFVYAGANMSIRLADLDEAFRRSFDAVLLNFEVPDEVIHEVCARARALNLPIIIDAGPARIFDMERMGTIEILSPNETETEALAGVACDTVDSAKAAAEELGRRSEAKHIVIKLGHRGALVYSDGNFHHVEAFDVDTVDTTAAGDAFTAGVAARYLRTGDLIDAVRFGNAAGAIAVTRLGAQPSLPDEAETLELYSSGCS